MGLVYADIELISVDDLVLYRRGYLPEDQIKHMRVSMLVDSGAYMLVINDRIREQLDLPFIEEQTMRLADETEMKVKIVGPVEVRAAFGGALALLDFDNDGDLDLFAAPLTEPRLYRNDNGKLLDVTAAGTRMSSNGMWMKTYRKPPENDTLLMRRSARA